HTVHEEPDLWASVGNTPLLALQLPPGQGELYLKAEWLNPGGSVKDRAARAILRDGLCRGELPGKRLLDASSGNTGIAYAMLGAGGFLKEKNPAIQLIGVQPDSPFHGLEGLKHLATTCHPPALYDPGVPDTVAEIATELADQTARRLARRTGILVGWSAGAA